MLQKEVKKYRTALYLRLSKEDGDKSESDSIANQRKMIEEYLSAHPDEFIVTDEYVDDGYSGSNFDRPGFRRLWDDIESGAVNCIVVKDLSRFGRNYIEVGRYLERIFPLLKVRLIALTDNYDGAEEWSNSDALLVPIKNLLNDAYCRDMSVKVKTQLDAKRKRGEFVGNYAPYGYKRHPNNHTQLIIDEPAAEVVRTIYQKKQEGMSDLAIADYLNQSAIPSPLEYRHMNGVMSADNFKRSDEALWSSKAVYRILHNEMYTGTLVQGKFKKIDYRSKVITHMPEDQWVRIEEMHDAIIDRRQYEIVQNLNSMDTKTPAGKDTVRLFSGLLVCGDCGSSMVRRASHDKGKKYYCYICNGYKKNKSCTSHYFGHKRLYDLVLENIRMQAEVAVKAESILDHIEKIPYRQKEIKNLDRRITEKQEELDKFKMIKSRLYEDYTSDLLTREEYMEYSELYLHRIQKTQDILGQLAEERKTMLSTRRDSEWITTFKKYRNITELARPILVELVQSILIYEDKRVEIKFRFQSVIDAWMSDVKEAANE